MNRGHEYNKQWRPRCALRPPTLALLEDCRLGAGHSPDRVHIQPGSPWARGTRKAWALDESVMWRRRDSVVHEVRVWLTQNKPLSPQTLSNLGFDPFLYQLKGMLQPPPERFEMLRRRLDELSVVQPDDLYRAGHFEQLGDLLGAEFKWVQLPKTKTNGDSLVCKAW